MSSLTVSAILRRLFQGRSLPPQAAAFVYRDYRFLWLSSLGHSLGMSIEMVSMGWLVLEMTNSPFMVGVASAARMAPFFFTGILAGAVADRVNRRIFLRFVSLGIGGMALLVALLLITNLLQVWHLLAIAVLSGVLRTFFMTTRQSLVYDVVGPRDALSGLAMAAMAMRTGGIVGSLFAGGIITLVGVQGAYLAMAVSYLFGFGALTLVREAGQAAPLERAPVWENFRGAFRLLRENRVLASLVAMTMVTEMLGFSHGSVLPVLARDVLHVGAGGLGVMMAARHGGGIIATLILAGQGSHRGKGKVLMAAVILFGIGIVGLSQAPSFLLALSFLAAINAMGALNDILQQTLAQAHVANEERGRAMGAWLVGIGAGPLGHMELGAVAGLLGAPAALLINGTALAASGVVWTVLFKHVRRL